MKLTQITKITHITKGVGGGFKPIPEYEAVLSAMATEPSIADKKIQNTMLKALVDGGYYAKAILLDNFSADTALNSLLNWKSPDTYNPVRLFPDEIKPIHISYAGFRGLSTGLIDLNVILNDVAALNKDNVCVIIGIGDNSISTKLDFGSIDSNGSNTKRFGVRSRYTGDVAYFYFVNAGADNTANSNSAKYFSMSRGNSLNFDAYLNKVKTVFTETSDGLPTDKIYACGGNKHTGVDISDKITRFVYVFQYLTETEIGAVIDIMEEYLSNYGTNLIWANNSDRIFTGEPKPYPSTTPTSLASTCNFRSIINVGGTYHLFEEGFGATWWIKKRTSTDGMSFSAVSADLFAAGVAGEFDQGGQADPTVIYEGVGDWKMWYDALGNGIWSLGYATSTDGTTWTKYGQILAPTPDTWDAQSNHHPVCIKHNGTYYLYYSGSEIGYANVIHHIGLATSTDGINFTKRTNPVIYAGESGEWDDQYVRPSNPILIDGLWYMWYWGFNGVANHTMGLAVSQDLINWTKRGQVLATNTIQPTASCGILHEGTSDKIVNLYYTQGNLYMAKVTIDNKLTSLAGFTSLGSGVFSKALTTTPTKVYFNNVLGNKQTAAVDVDSEYDWFWESNVLKIYSAKLPDLVYLITYE